MRAHEIRVCILIDSSNARQRRKCFWPQALQEWQKPGALGSRLVWQEVALQEVVAQGKHLDLRQYDVVVVNWDLLNGDPVFLSDRSQLIARHYATDLRHFVRRGGLAIVECQAVMWSPCQPAYDCIITAAGLPGLRVVDSSSVGFGFSVRPEKRLLGHHPFLPEALGQLVRPVESEWSLRGDWFPESSVSMRVLQEFEGTRNRMYSGAFARTRKREWLPLLFAEDGRHPVACLYHERDEGAYLATTMYLAAANVSELLRPMTVDWHASRPGLNIHIARR